MCTAVKLKMNNHSEDDAAQDLAYEVNENGERVLVKSLVSASRAYLRFSNRTNRPVDIWWRDFHGRKRIYTRLLPRRCFEVDSYISHVWQFTDSITKENYVVNNNPIFRPPNSIGGMMYRTNWNITISVRSLRDTCLLFVAQCIKQSSEVSTLELPKILEDEVKRTVQILHKPMAGERRD